MSCSDACDRVTAEGLSSPFYFNGGRFCPSPPSRKDALAAAHNASRMLLRLSAMRASRRAVLVGSGVLAASASAAVCATCEPAKAADSALSRVDSGGASSYLPGPVKAAYDTVCNAVYDNVIKDFAEPSRDKLLPDLPPQVVGKEKPTLVVSLDGCLIQSSWTRQHGWRYLKRPGVDQFLASLAPLYELVLWTDTMNAGDPVVDKLDPRRHTCWLTQVAPALGAASAPLARPVRPRAQGMRRPAHSGAWPRLLRSLKRRGAAHL